MCMRDIRLYMWCVFLSRLLYLAKNVWFCIPFDSFKNWIINQATNTLLCIKARTYNRINNVCILNRRHLYIIALFVYGRSAATPSLFSYILFNIHFACMLKTSIFQFCLKNATNYYFIVHTMTNVTLALFCCFARDFISFICLQWFVWQFLLYEKKNFFFPELLKYFYWLLRWI